MRPGRRKKRKKKKKKNRQKREKRKDRKGRRNRKVDKEFLKRKPQDVHLSCGLFFLF